MCGTPETNRTSDLPLRRGLLYPLSYRGISRQMLPEPASPHTLAPADTASEISS
jgi:hypothetical protein